MGSATPGSQSEERGRGIVADTPIREAGTLRPGWHQHTYLRPLARTRQREFILEAANALVFPCTLSVSLLAVAPRHHNGRSRWRLPDATITADHIADVPRRTPLSISFPTHYYVNTPITTTRNTAGSLAISPQAALLHRGQQVKAPPRSRTVGWISALAPAPVAR